MTKIWITKYALTSGISEVEVEEFFEGRARVDGYYTSFQRSEYALTKREAIDKFEELKAKKLISLKKQLKKIENMKAKFK